MRRLLALAVVLSVAAATARPAHATRIARVTVDGKTLESKDRLLRFLGLVEGADCPDPAALEERVDEALRSLGYEKLESSFRTTAAGIEVRLAIAPAQVVRHLRVRGNGPIFEEEIRRRVTLRPGSRLPPEPERTEVLRQEEQRLRDFLHRDGYFEADVTIKVRPANRPEWIDLVIAVRRGDWFHLKDVLVEGATVLKPKDFLGYFGSIKPGWAGRLRLDELRDNAREAEKAYRDLGYPAARVVAEFDPALDIAAGTNAARLRLRVIEKAKLDIHFTGQHHLTERQLREKITIFSSGSYDDVELEQSAREIARLYQSHGFLEARVTAVRKHVGPVEDITFAVEEGPELKVREVQIVEEPGAPALGEKEVDALHDLITTRPFPRLGDLGLGGGGYVTSVQLAQDTEKILLFEKAAGCPEPKVRGEVARAPEALGHIGVLGADVAADFGREQDLYVRFAVDKGRCETLASFDVQFVGPHQRGATEIAAIAGLQPGQAYVAEALQAARRRLIDYYASHGHPYAAINPPRFDWDAAHSHVRIGLTIDEGPEVRFGEILIRGNFKTADWVIRRNLPFSTGDLFDVTKIAAAERNLQTHAIFNGVRVIPFGISSRTVNPVPILVEIQQERYDDWGSLVLSAGYSTDVGLLISPGYFWGNVFGGGGNAELRLEAAFDVTQAPSVDYTSPFYRRLAASLRYVHPHLIWPSLRAEVIGFARKETTVRLGEIDSLGFGIPLSYIVSQSLRFFGRYDLTFSSLGSIPYQRLPGRNDAIATVADNTRTGKVTLGAVFDDRTSFDGAKNPLMPTRGVLLAASVGWASRWFQGTDDFVVVSGQYQHYLPVGDTFTFILHLRGDWGFPLGGETELPAVDRFFAGGDVATRGFETDKLRTELYGTEIAPGVTAYRVVPRGGNIRLLGTLELQFIITRIAGFPLAGALFTDVGTLFDSPALFQPRNDIRVSVGVSVLRLLTPVGPISLEYAYPLTQGIVEQEWKSQPWYRHWPGLIHFNWGIPILR